eukprot:evm.model.scf_1009.2 EVM.evm.TU.scf_1009.2   scf_1009:10842-19479(+)
MGDNGERRAGHGQVHPPRGAHMDPLRKLEAALSHKGMAHRVSVEVRVAGSEAGGKGGAACPSGWLRRASQAVDRGISQFFGRLGALVGGHPYLVIALCLLLAGASSLPVVNKVFPGRGPIAFKEEKDRDRLYAPRDSQAARNGDFVENLYESEPLTQLVLVARNRSQGASLNILTRESISEAWDLWEWIRLLEVVVDGQPYRWEDLCARVTIPRTHEALPCKMFSIFDVWDMNRTAFNLDPDILTTITKKTVAPGETVLKGLARGAANGYGALLYRDLILGQDYVQYDEDGILQSAESLRFTLIKNEETRDVHGKQYDPVSTAWEAALIDLVVFKWQGRKVQGYAVSLEELDRQSGDQIVEDTSWVVVSYILVIAVSHVVLFRNNRSFCKAQLTMVSIFAITMAIATSIGVVNLIGVPYAVVVATVPFLLVGLGVDDTFVIMGAYATTPVYHSAQQRIEETMMRAGTSIFVTSLTDFVAFAFGTFTRIPAVRTFCLYAAAGVLFDFIYQVTFFVAFVALDTRREERSRKGATLMGLGPNFKEMTHKEAPKLQEMAKMGDGKSEKPGGEAVPHVVNRKRTYENQLSMEEWKLQTGEEYPKCFGKGEFNPQKPSITRRAIGEWLPRLTLHPVGMFVVIMTELLIVGAAIYGCTKVYMDFQITTWFVPKGSWLNDAFAIEDKYFGGVKINFHVYTKEPEDGSNYFDHQDELEALGKAMAESPDIANRPFPFTYWYDNYVLWSKLFHAKELVDGRAPNATAFTAWMQEFLSTTGQGHIGDVIFSEDGSRIVSTRTLAFMSSEGRMSELIGAADAIQAAAAAAAPTLRAFPFGFLFPFLEGFRIITSETIKNVVSAAAAVAVICLFVLADAVATASVVAMVMLTDLWLFGSMWYADLTFNILTSNNIVMAVGIAIDYSVHVGHSFLVVDGSRRERAQKALYHIGGEVFSGALTTYLAVCALAFAKHYIFRAFFKMLTVIILGGVWHGLVLLPVVLALVGPPSYGSRS